MALQQIGPYTLTQLCGVGGFGAGYDPVDNKRVVIEKESKIQLQGTIQHEMKVYQEIGVTTGFPKHMEYQKVHDQIV